MRRIPELKNYSSRLMTRFIEEIIKQDNRNKLPDFCNLYNFDINELRELVRLNLKYGQPDVMKQISKDKSLVADIKRWMDMFDPSFISEPQES